MNIKTDYNHTVYASYIGYITQAVVNNFAPLLFLTFSRQFGLSLDKITLITSINFAVQLAVDLISAKFIDKIGYRVSVVLAHILSSLGLAGLAVLPGMMKNSYAGILASVVLYAVGGGLLEVMISPIVEACPTQKKEAAMSLLHSFYCWGHVGVVLVSALFFRVCGIEHWRILAALWAVIPLVNVFYFSQVPLYSITQDREPISLGKLFGNRMFRLFMVLMVCAGASEQAMSQWASAFAEAALGVPKTAGDLAGPCTFAALMGTARLLYGKFGEKLALKKAMTLCAVLCVGAYLTATLTKSPAAGFVGCGICGFSVGIFWPGTFSLAASEIKGAGTAMFAFMALAGDAGCSAGPALVGLVSGAAGDNLKTGLLAAVVFPLIILVGSLCLKKDGNDNIQ
ncbi:MAG: MFS transporter [Clostridia bacterium]|nr:MFS transporter [Clostridia bacterium]